ncbi:cupin domain-containing protein [Caulobacter sp. KR2-114]|uniref:cupin domain-containing protein n=1 Tax=Caulobacter sp. KR2-114 TaxID=3400912 RepID=UPI003C0D0386
MMTARQGPWAAAAAGVIAATMAASVALAAAPADPVHKTTLQTLAFPAAPLHSVTVRTVIDPGGMVKPHTHPGAEMAYVVSGRGEVAITGRAPQPLAAGSSFAVPPDTVHSVRNLGRAPLVLVSTYVVDQTRPIASPAP